LSAKQKEYAQQMLGDIHQQFIAVVKSGRGSRIKDSPELFSGLVWNGKRSIELGLTDALGSVRSVARDVVKAEDIVDFTVQENVAERVARKFGAVAGRGFATTADGPLRLW
jgi:protease-4